MDIAINRGGARAARQRAQTRWQPQPCLDRWMIELDCDYSGLAAGGGEGQVQRIAAFQEFHLIRWPFYKLQRGHKMFQTWVHGIFHHRQVQSCPEPAQRLRGDSALVDDSDDDDDDDSVRAHSNRPRANTIDDVTTSRRRSDAAVSAWDSKRELCQNCKHIYLKFLSPCTGFCSLDCQSNAAYLLAVSEGIRAAAAHVAAPSAAASSIPVASHKATLVAASTKNVSESVTVVSKLSFAIDMSHVKGVSGDRRSSEPVGSNTPTTQGSPSSIIDFDQDFDDDDDSYDTMERHTYSDFYTEKLRLARPVEWNFSALY